MRQTVKASLLAIALMFTAVAANAQGAGRHPSSGGTSTNNGTVIVAPQYPTPNAPSQPTYNPPVYVPATQDQTAYQQRTAQINARLAQIRQQQDQLRQEERALRDEQRRLNQAYNVNGSQQQQYADGKHDNGKHKGWYKNGKANGAKANKGEDRDDD